MARRMKKGDTFTKYNNRYHPVTGRHVGEVREMVDRKGRVGFLARIVGVKKDKVIYKIEA